MACEYAKKKNVKDLKFYLKQRGVLASNLRKLIHKCMNAQTFLIATDLDGLLDNGHKNTKKKH